MNCHDLNGMWSISILKRIFENLILLRDRCINTNEVIWLYEKVSVSTNGKNLMKIDI